MKAPEVVMPAVAAGAVPELIAPADDVAAFLPEVTARLELLRAAYLSAAGKGQWRSNSGMFFMDLYEIQLLDSFPDGTDATLTTPVGQCGALDKLQPPAVNACRGPGEWQSFDILFTRPPLQPVAAEWHSAKSAGVQTASLHLQVGGATSAGRLFRRRGIDCIVADDSVQWPTYDRLHY